MAGINRGITQGGPDEMGPGSRTSQYYGEYLNEDGTRYNPHQWEDIGGHDYSPDYTRRAQVDVYDVPMPTNSSLSLNYESPKNTRWRDSVGKFHNNDNNSMFGSPFKHTVDNCREWIYKQLTGNCSPENIQWMRSRLKQGGDLSPEMDEALRQLQKEYMDGSMEQEVWKPSQALLDGIQHRF